jgi:two-component system, NtrC family, response regulator AtoC
LLPPAPEPAQLDATRIDMPPQPQPVEPDHNREVFPLHVQLRAVERRALERALNATHQNRAMAARLLGISRTQLYAKLGDHGLVRY